MAIQFRHGVEPNLDKTKLLAGEPAFCTDSKKLFVGGGDGTAAQTGDMLQATYANGNINNPYAVDVALEAQNAQTGSFLAAQLAKQKCIVYNSTSEWLANSTDTVLTFDTIVANDDSMFAASGSNRITAHTPGFYLILADAAFDSNGTGTRSIWITHSSAGRIAAQTAPATATDNIRLHTAALAYMAAGDYVYVQAWQNSGGSLQVNNFGQMPRLQGIRLA